MDSGGTDTVAETTGTGTDTTQSGSTQSTAGDGVTREQLDQIIGQKTSQHKRSLKRARDEAASSAVSALFSELGVEDLEELRNAVDGRREKQSESDTLQTQVRKLERELRNAVQQRDELGQTLGALKNQVNAGRIRSAVAEAAAKYNAYDDLVFAVVKSEDMVGVDEDGHMFVRGDSGEPVDGMTIDGFVKKLVSERTHLLRPTPGQGAGSRPAADITSNGSAGKDLLTAKGMADAAMQQLRDKGILP